MLRVSDLKFGYGDSQKSYKYDMQLEKGEIASIMGKSGSGKSTLFDLIDGFLTPTSGSITLNDKELVGQSVESRPVSVLFQEHNLFEHLSVEKNVILGISRGIFDTKADKKRVSQMLEEVGLKGFEKKLVSSLSGGEQQRVALARVLLRQEPILLLDEPFNSLDEQTRLEMLELVREMTTKHALHTLIITHNSSSAQKISDKIYLMEDGVFESMVISD